MVAIDEDGSSSRSLIAIPSVAESAMPIQHESPAHVTRRRRRPARAA
ncbi:hypothetical protein DB32_001345 [Sandaracinus amylolyticus]|uniref:Uncharacterized protein n=1 Tax=Sandaracinus amylolyticus TaxID=927083 RepID=A0A0F6W0L7_9BACT|nr:hypothetical protein DB32_001345 [Sandaracinus amylolyticus]